MRLSSEEARLNVYASAADMQQKKGAAFQPAIDWLNSDGLGIQVLVYDRDAQPL